MALGNLSGQGGHHMGLTDDILKGLRAVFPV
jgi:hypothetical protein